MDEHRFYLVLGHLVSLGLAVVNGRLFLQLSLKLVYLLALLFGYLLDRCVASKLVIVISEYLMFLFELRVFLGESCI